MNFVAGCYGSETRSRTRRPEISVTAVGGNNSSVGVTTCETEIVMTIVNTEQPHCYVV